MHGGKDCVNGYGYYWDVGRGDEGRERVIKALLDFFARFKGKKGKLRLMGWAKD